MWLAARPDDDVPGWADFDTDDGEPILQEEAVILFNEMEQFLCKPQVQDSRELLAEFVERAINLLDGMCRDADCELEQDDEMETDEGSNSITLNPNYQQPAKSLGFSEMEQAAFSSDFQMRDLFTPRVAAQPCSAR